MASYFAAMDNWAIKAEPDMMVDDDSCWFVEFLGAVIYSTCIHH